MHVQTSTLMHIYIMHVCIMHKHMLLDHHVCTMYIHTLLDNDAYDIQYLTMLLYVCMISYHVFQFGNLLNIGLMVTMATIR